MSTRKRLANLSGRRTRAGIAITSFLVTTSLSIDSYAFRDTFVHGSSFIAQDGPNQQHLHYNQWGVWNDLDGINGIHVYAGLPISLITSEPYAYVDWVYAIVYDRNPQDEVVVELCDIVTSDGVTDVCQIGTTGDPTFMSGEYNIYFTGMSNNPIYGRFIDGRVPGLYGGNASNITYVELYHNG